MRIAIAESSPRGMMCSYAAINGSASCENGALLTTWARKSTGFVGNVVTDCGALAMSSEPADPAISAAAALNAGTDLNCGKTFEKGLANAIASNYTTIGQLDISLQRSIILLMEAGCGCIWMSTPYLRFAMPPCRSDCAILCNVPQVL